MIIDVRFVFYCYGFICGFILLEVLRVVQIFRARRGQHLRDSRNTGEGYKKFVDKWSKYNFNK
jgi:hypothetical protein